MAVGALIKIVLAYLLIAIPEVGVYGAPISTFACDAVITVINIAQIYKLTSKRMGVIKVYIKPVLSSGMAMLVSLISYITMLRITKSERLSFILSAPVAIMVYFITAFLTKTVTQDDLKMMPFLSKIKKRTKSDVPRS